MVLFSLCKKFIYVKKGGLGCCDKKKEKMKEIVVKRCCEEKEKNVEM